MSNKGVHGTIFGENIDFFLDHNIYRSKFLVCFGWYKEEKGIKAGL
jgi:hypothetical protein